MKSNALKINPADNVAIAIMQIGMGEDVVVDGARLLAAAEDIEPSHKIALVPLKPGDNVVRYGQPIVQATRDMEAGQWVHVHNTRPVKRPLTVEGTADGI